MEFNTQTKEYVNIYLDSGIQILVNKKIWLSELIKNIKVRRQTKSKKVGSIKSSSIWFKKYIIFIFLFFCTYNTKNVSAHVQKKVYLIEKLEA